MINLDGVLTGVTRLGLDTAPIIYFVEAHAQYDLLITEVFRRIADGNLTGVTSVVTLTEVLVQPFRQGQERLQNAYYELLIGSANFETLSVNAVIAEHAARIRARHNLRTPDALQMATVLNAGCQAFLTNDASLKRVTELRVLILNELAL